MSKTTEKTSKVEYGDPTNITIFDEYEKLQQIKELVKKGKAEKVFNYSNTLTDTYEKLVKSINVLSEGQTVEAKIIAELGDAIIVSVSNCKDSVYIQKSRKEIPFLKGRKLDDVINIVITSIKENPYMVTGSIASLYEKKLQEELKNPHASAAYEAVIKSSTPAGYNIELSYGDIILPAFMPNTLAGVNKLHDPLSILGQTMKVMIESYSTEKGTYIVSRRKYLQTLIGEEIKRLKYDTVYEGHITGTTPFGLFVEFNGCLTGMIHKTNINPEWQDKLDQVKPGMIVDFYIKEIIKDKIILTQILKESLWDNIKNGQKISGKVKDVKQFGALIQLDEETIGLVHISELEKSKRTVKAGDPVNIKVLLIDRSARKIFLSIVD